MNTDNQTDFAKMVLASPTRVAMPIGVYAGLEITGSSVFDAVTNAAAQAEAVLALHERYHTAAMLTAMDLSAEAEAFGCQIRMDKEDIPTVIGRRVASSEDIANLPVPQPGDARTAVHLEAVRRLAASGRAPVIGGLIGPFSLAGRIVGVSEALELTVTGPEMLLPLLEKCAAFLAQYARAFREAGASGVIMAEPAAGLLSPRALGRFSAPFVRQIAAQAQGDDFRLILHNCAAKIQHLPRVLESGADIYHFGAPMDLIAALGQVDGQTILCGNLDPAAVFYSGTPETVFEKTRALLDGAANHRNFIVSSGCDLPPHTPLANLDAFFAAAAAG